MPHAAALQADIANYTTIAPVVQFSVVEIAESQWAHVAGRPACPLDLRG
jgi:hypothetical protein